VKGTSFEPAKAKVDRTFEREIDGGWFVPVIVSLLLHGSLVALLLLVMPREEARVIKPPPSYVAARIVTVEAPKPPAKIPPKTVPAREIKPAKPEPDKAAIALKRKQEEERKKAEQRRQQELKKKRERELAQQKERELKRRRAEELRKKQERERVLKQQEQELQAALAREAEQAAADAGVVAGYAGLLQRVVESEWTRPASVRQGMKTTLRIQLLPSGQLISVQILAGSGNEAFDRSAVQAVERAAPFTELQDMEARLFEKNFRTLRFVFNPEDLLK